MNQSSADRRSNRQNPARENRHLALRMGWHHLLFLHWTTDAKRLSALLPRHLEPDLFEGRAYVGLVPFTMRRVRPRVLPGLPFAPQLYENFHETNVRTYVRDRQGRSGVWFFSLDAANFPAVLAARSWFRLPYFYAAMSVRATPRHFAPRIEYSSRRLWPDSRQKSKNDKTQIGCDIKIQIEKDAPFRAEAGSLEEFLVERYALFSGNDTALFRGIVRHKPYLLRRARLETLQENLIAAAGIEYSKSAAPHILYADEARVEAFITQRLETLNFE